MLRERSMTTSTPAASGGTVSQTPSCRDLVQKHQAAFKVAGILLAKRDQKNSVKTERKAIKVLGIMFAIFVVCWAPFFTVNFTMGVCSSCDLDPLVFKVFLWFGYFGSTLNPIVYTVFNKNFRQFFLKKLRPLGYLVNCSKCCEKSRNTYTPVRRFDVNADTIVRPRQTARSRTAETNLDVRDSPRLSEVLSRVRKRNENQS